MIRLLARLLDPRRTARALADEQDRAHRQVISARVALITGSSWADEFGRIVCPACGGYPDPRAASVDACTCKTVLTREGSVAS